jgi:hypothetical protein
MAKRKPKPEEEHDHEPFLSVCDLVDQHGAAEMLRALAAQIELAAGCEDVRAACAARGVLTARLLRVLAAELAQGGSD